MLVSVSTGVSVLDGVGRRLCVFELVCVFEKLMEGVTELEYEVELEIDG